MKAGHRGGGVAHRRVAEMDAGWDGGGGSSWNHRGKERKGNWFSQEFLGIVFCLDFTVLSGILFWHRTL